MVETFLNSRDSFEVCSLLESEPIIILIRWETKRKENRGSSVAVENTGLQVPDVVQSRVSQHDAKAAGLSQSGQVLRNLIVSSTIY